MSAVGTAHIIKTLKLQHYKCKINLQFQNNYDNQFETNVLYNGKFICVLPTALHVGGFISPTNKLVGYNIDRLYESWF
jgi:hypothetical protein